MTQGKRTVVPFEHPAAYWAVRARRHYHQDQLPDAARFMRKALEKSGDPGLALELSQIYRAMGCLTAAERCLIRATARLGLTGSLSYAIGCCALNRGQEELAEDALDVSLRLEPNGPYADRAQELLETYPWQDEPRRPRCARGETLCYQSRDALAAGQRDRALRLARKAWEMAHTPAIALQLGSLLPPAEAEPFLHLAARYYKDRPGPMLLRARGFDQCGNKSRARWCLRIAERQCSTITDVEAFCETAWAIGLPRQADHLLRAQLEKLPASVDLLRLKYLCLLRMNEEEKARRTLETLLEIDADDASALWYRRHPQEWSLLKEREVLLSALGSLVYAAPERLKRGPLNRMLHGMVMIMDGEVSTELIYRELPPLWRRLPGAAKRACDLRQSSHYPLSFAVYLYWITGQPRKARDLLAAVPGKKRILRALRQYLRWRMEEEETP